MKLDLKRKELIVIRQALSTLREEEEMDLADNKEDYEEWCKTKQDSMTKQDKTNWMKYIEDSQKQIDTIDKLLEKVIDIQRSITKKEG